MAKSHRLSYDEHGMRRWTRWARHGVAGFALLACVVSLSIILHDRYSAHGVDVSHGPGTHALVDPAAVVVDSHEDKHRVLGEYLARRYLVSAEATTNIVAKAHAIGAEVKLDPLLILAVIAVESRFNPIAESTRGAKGLMQVVPHYHPDKFNPLGGEKMAFEPRANIMVGARILTEYLRRTGDLGEALRMYVGATAEENEYGYSIKVMSERDRLKLVLRQHQSRNAL